MSPLALAAVGGVLLLCVPGARAHVVASHPTTVEPYYCNWDGCPRKHIIDGFEVRTSPAFDEDESASYDDMGRALRYIEAELTMMTAPGQIPKLALARLRESGVSIYLAPSSVTTGEFEDSWWPCGENGGCYTSASRRAGVTTETMFRYYRIHNYALHELAHAYQNLVVRDGDNNLCIRRAYEEAVSSGKYRNVKNDYRYGRSVEDGYLIHPEAYAITNRFEYWAEATEAFYYFNGAYPFTRHDLFEHDPLGYHTVKALWRDPDAACPSVP